MSTENSPVQLQKSSCIFCNIVNKMENTEVIFEDEDVCVFRDIKPASDFHILTIPKRHIDDVKSLTAADKDLVEKMLSVAKELLSKNNLPLDNARFGYHWPPFRSIKHLHLHTIAPESKMGFIGNMIFRKNSYWFVSGCGDKSVHYISEYSNTKGNLWILVITMGAAVKLPGLISCGIL